MRVLAFLTLALLAIASAPAAQAHTCDGGTGCGPCPQDDGAEHDHRYRSGGSQYHCSFQESTEGNVVPALGPLAMGALVAAAALVARRAGQ